MTRIVAVTLVLVVLSVAAWWTLVLEPARDQQVALEDETAQLRAEEGQLTNQREQLLALRDRAPLIRDDLDRLSALIPPDPDQARLLELVQAAASASGVSFTSLAFTDPAPVADAPPAANPQLVLGETTVAGSMRATYFQLVDFLRRLEVGSSRAILITAVGLAEGEEGFPQLDATFTAQIFSLLAAPADTGPPPGTVPAEPAEPGDLVPATETPPPVPTPTPTGDDAAQSDLPAVRAPEQTAHRPGSST